MSKDAPVFSLYSSAFQNSALLPVTCSSAKNGKNASPPLNWENAPDSTRSYALIMEDIDIPRLFSPFTGKMTHWALNNIPAAQTALDEGMKEGRYGLGGIIQPRNAMRRRSYLGPNPICGTHRYLFTLYALDTAFSDPDLNITGVRRQMKGHTLSSARLMGIYSKGA
jgi:Raf kinase inhibitor-like YbhB/YbcL family protein